MLQQGAAGADKQQTVSLEKEAQSTPALGRGRGHRGALPEWAQDSRGSQVEAAAQMGAQR